MTQGDRISAWLGTRVKTRTSVGKIPKGAEGVVDDWEGTRPIVQFDKTGWDPREWYWYSVSTEDLVKV